MNGLSIEHPSGREAISPILILRFGISFLLLGALLRILQFAAGISFWGDELALALNIVERALGPLLTTPLDHNQVAPQGFLFAARVGVVVFGNNEYAMRIFSLAGALVALPLFWLVARRVLVGPAVLLATGLFALGLPFIRYGAELKQYSTDVAACLLMILVVLQRRHEHSLQSGLLLGILGAVAIWFSMTTVLVLAGLGAAMVLNAVLDHKFIARRKVIGPTAILWGGAATISVLHGLHNVTPETHEYMQAFWASHFMPWPPTSLKEGLWLTWQLEGIFAELMEYRSAQLYLVAALLGFWSLWRRDRRVFSLLIGPLLVTLLASALHQYPFGGRVNLFLVPLLLIATAEGADWVLSFVSPRAARALRISLPMFPIVLALGVGTSRPAYHIYQHEQTAPVLAHIQTHRMANDRLYIYYAAEKAHQYYTARSGLDSMSAVVGGCHRGDGRAYLREVDAFRGEERAWFFFSHPRFHERTAILAYLERIGTRLDTAEEVSTRATGRPGAAAYLFDLSDPDRLARATAGDFPLPKSVAFPQVPKALRCR